MRYSSIDVLRMVAIFVMVIVHFLENLSGIRNWSPDGFGAPLFTFLTGMSYRLWLSGQDARQTSDSQISKITVRRGLFLFGLGFVFNFFVWLPEDIFIWDVLTFIGVALMTLNVVRSFPAPLLITSILLSFAVSPVLQKLADYPAYWTEGYFSYDQTLSDVLLGFLVTGYFPIFPWIGFPITGFLVASAIFHRDGRPLPSTAPLIIAGLTLLTVSATTVVTGWYVPTLLTTAMFKGWSMFPASLEYISGTLGMTILLFTCCHLVIDRSEHRSRGQGVLQVASTFSRHSLSIYLLHHVVHIWPLWIYGLWMNKETTYYWGKAFSYATSLSLALLFIVSCYFFLRWIDRNRLPTMESVMRWVCD